MGMFDYIRCKYPLPVDGFQDRTWQTKDTPGYPSMDLYEIREDGSLWHQGYDVEDRSDPKAEGLMGLRGAMTRVNKKWGRVPSLTGEIRFYDFKHSGNGDYAGWLEFSAYFVNGKLSQIHCVENRDGDKRADASG